MSAAHNDKKSSLTEAEPHGEPVCANCDTPINGNFCHNCGQSVHVHHSLLHLLEEMVHGLWHFDAKGWRTIPLLIADPGELTRRYIDGQRVRFISPLGLFLFMVFFMFFVFSFSKTSTLQLGNEPVANATKQAVTGGVNKGMDDAKAAVARAQTALDQAKLSGIDVADRQADLDTARADQKELEDGIKALANLTDPDKKTGQDIQIEGANSEKLKRLVQHALDNKELVAYKMKNNAYKFALILVPVSLPFLWMMFFWRKNITLFDHAVFSLYSLSFMAFFAAMISVLFELDWSSLGAFLLLTVPPVHMYRQLKGTYRLSGIEATWRTIMLLFSALLMVLLFILFVGALSLT